MKKLHRCLRCLKPKSAEEFSKYKGSPILCCLTCERGVECPLGDWVRFWAAVEEVQKEIERVLA